MTKIVLVNQTSVLTAADVTAVIPVMQTLFDRDFEPVWGTGLAFKFSSVVDVGLVPMDAWPVYLLDTTDVPGAGGYHEDQGLPFGKVFAMDANDAGESWTVDLSHEVLEMASDPTADVLIDLHVSVLPGLSSLGMPGFSCLREVGDAVEEDTLGYMIDNVLVTDWCTPEYFYQTRVAGYNGPCGQFDFMGHLDAPAPALLHGGYLGILNRKTQQWGQVSAFDMTGKPSRRSVRTMGRINRIASKSPSP